MTYSEKMAQFLLVGAKTFANTPEGQQLLKELGLEKFLIEVNSEKNTFHNSLRV